MLDRLRRAYLRRRSAARWYRALAARESHPDRRSLLGVLAASEDRRAFRYARSLRRVGAETPADDDSWLERGWRWVLATCGIKAALAWLVWKESEDRQLLRIWLAAKRAGTDESGNTLQRNRRVL